MQRKNVGQSNYYSQSKCATPEGGFSIGDAQVIVTRLELPIPPDHGGEEEEQGPLE